MIGTESLIVALKYRIPGLGLSLAILSAWLICLQKHNPNADGRMTFPIYAFMTFSIVVFIIGAYVFTSTNSKNCQVEKIEKMSVSGQDVSIMNGMFNSMTDHYEAAFANKESPDSAGIKELSLARRDKNEIQLLYSNLAKSLGELSGLIASCKKGK